MIRLPGALQRHPLATLIVVALAVRFALTPLYAYLPNGLLDEGFWKHWMQAINEDGVLNIFRTTDTDYVGYHWVLWLLAIVYDVIGGPYTQTTPSLHILVKMPSILFDVALILVVFHATAALLRDEGRALPSQLPLAAAAVIAFHPVVLYDSAIWGQTDSAITAAMLGALLLAMRGRAAMSGAVYALGFAVKPHPIIIVHLLGYALLRAGAWKALLRALAAFAVVAAIVLGPWILHGDVARIIDVYQLLFSKDHHRLSELAWNVWWIVDQAGDPRPESAIISGFSPLTYRLTGLGLSAIAALISLAYMHARPGMRGTLIAAAYQAFAFYALPIASHERYLYPFIGLLLPAVFVDRRWLWLYVPVSVTFFLNLFIVAPPIRELADRWVYQEFGVITAAVHTAIFCAFSVVMVAGAFNGLRWKQRHATPPPVLARAPERS